MFGYPENAGIFEDFKVVIFTLVAVGANWTLRSNCIGGGQAQYLVSYV